MSAATVIAAPSFGPAVVIVAGQEIPVLATGVSTLALLLARMIAPPALRRLAAHEQAALTILLLLLLFVTVWGELPLIGTGKPLTTGMAVLVGVCLGFSGLMVVEAISEPLLAKIRSVLAALFGGTAGDNK